MTKKIIQHSKVKVEHYTPEPILDSVRELFGKDIDLDPATTKAVNDKTVRAKSFFTKEDNGLSKEWHGSVYLNPPGDLIRNHGIPGLRALSSSAYWFSKLTDEYNAKRVQEAIFLGFNLEVQRLTQHPPCKVWIGDFPVCIVAKRLEFLDENFKPQESPAHPNLIAYLPKDNASVDKFINIFSKFGRIK